VRGRPHLFSLVFFKGRGDGHVDHSALFGLEAGERAIPFVALGKEQRYKFKDKPKERARHLHAYYSSLRDGEMITSFPI